VSAPVGASRLRPCRRSSRSPCGLAPGLLPQLPQPVPSFATRVVVPVRPRRGARGGPPSRTVVDRPQAPRHRHAQIIRRATEEDLDQEDHNRGARGRTPTRSAASASRRASCRWTWRGRRRVRRQPDPVLLLPPTPRGLRSWSRTWRRHYRRRIELRQIVVRDQAKRLDGCGRAGGRSAATTFMREFPPGHAQMAPRAAAPRSTAARSPGACGRVMCCLSYELAQYRTARAGCAGGARSSRPARADEVIRAEVFRKSCGSATTRAASTGSRSRPAAGPYHECGDCNCGRSRARTGRRVAGGRVVSERRERAVRFALRAGDRLQPRVRVGDRVLAPAPRRCGPTAPAPTIEAQPAAAWRSSSPPCARSGRGRARRAHRVYLTRATTGMRVGVPTARCSATWPAPPPWCGERAARPALGGGDRGRGGRG